ncbi:DNA mismatch repair protein msh3 [Pelomyxa schiedti]|nr:DNA mismatch repair protein msh3 [Pelomyxa schiedti]
MQPLQPPGYYFCPCRTLSEHYGELHEVVLHMAKLDCLFSLAAVAQKTGYVRPKFTEIQTLEIREGRNPIVEAILSDSFVPNSVSLAGTRRCLIITGPNMGGKSSYSRQVALIVIMAQIGSFVPAEYTILSPCDAVYTRLFYSGF